MDENLKYYLENTLVFKTVIESRLTHPITKLRYPTRLVFDVLRKYAKDFLESGIEPRFISLAGLRGVGKTTLLWQTANYIISNYKINTYFFNVNTLRNLDIDLHIALEEFQRIILKKRFNELTEPIILLFDEVHDDENWSRTLKILYDEARTAFILCTGSSALLLNQTADLTRRMRIEKIYPFKFIEFIAAKSYLEKNGKMIVPIKGLSKNLKEILFYSDSSNYACSQLKDLEINVKEYFDGLKDLNSNNFKDLLQGYINYQNIPAFLFYKDNIIINDSILDLFKRVILEDIPKLKPTISEYNKIEKLILRLAGSDEINPEKLSSLIGIKQEEVANLIDILAKSELLNVLMPYGGLDSKILKNKKAFFMSPSLRRALLSTLYGQRLPEIHKSKLIEDIVVMYLKRILTDSLISFHSGSKDSNPDFVIETKDKPILLEVGTSKTSLKQLVKTNIDNRYALLISNGITTPQVSENFLRIPLSWFFLL